MFMRVVENNHLDRTITGPYAVSRIEKIEKAEGGQITVDFLDGALDKSTIRADYGQMIQIYH